MLDITQFSHQEAFERNIGLVSEKQLELLSQKLVVLPGCGGVGGVHAQTMARLGVGRFRVADPDTFSLVNFNRQLGATMQTLGENKAKVIADMILSINPQADVAIYQEGLTESNTADFVDGADLVIDGIDFFTYPARRRLYKEAWQREIPVMISAPLGFSGTLHVFDKPGLSFDDYFDMHDGQSLFEQVVNFYLGLAPAALHVPYMDLTSARPEEGRAPSSYIGAQLSASLVGAEAVRVLLGHPASIRAPQYLQFDAYRHKMHKGYLYGGNRNWLQRLKRRLVMRKFRQLHWDTAINAMHG